MAEKLSDLFNLSTIFPLTSDSISLRNDNERKYLAEFQKHPDHLLRDRYNLLLAY